MNKICRIYIAKIFGLTINNKYNIYSSNIINFETKYVCIFRLI